MRHRLSRSSKIEAKRGVAGTRNTLDRHRGELPLHGSLYRRCIEGFTGALLDLGIHDVPMRIEHDIHEDRAMANGGMFGRDPANGFGKYEVR